MPHLSAARRLVMMLALACAGAASAQTFDLDLPEDTLLYVANRGATRVLVDLNGARFKLVAEPAEAATSPNAYLIPRTGAATLDIAAYMRPAGNRITFTVQGPAGAGSDFVIAPVFVEGQTGVTHVVRGLVPVPEAFALRAGPNPGRGPLTVTFDVPAERVAGVPVRLTVSDALGRTVAVLADGVRYPGTFRLVWPANVAAGVYLVRLETDTDAETVAVTRVR